MSGAGRPGAAVRCGTWLLGCLAAAACPAARVPVLGQIDLPHPYYYREMLLPQLTAGPSALAWSPDSTALVFSMGGDLWRQRVAATATAPAPAEQLPAGSGYAYQPDWSPDGRWVLYTEYDGNAMELWVSDLETGTAHALTANGAVNVEARFSPDGRRVVFTSTLFNRRFHVFTADFADGGLANVRRLTGEHRSDLPRYYYSAYDHEINPVWTRDGRDVIYVSNRDHIYGTGGIWRVPADGSGPARELHYEETNWKARPDVSADGSRLVFSSYVGRAWHTLWLMPTAGGDAFPLTYGEWDQTNARWSPDGARVAFISNRGGGTEIDLVPVPGGDPHPLPLGERHYLGARARLRLALHDGAGAPGAARVSVTDGTGRFHAPDAAWIHADDGVDHTQRRFEAHYFHARGTVDLDVPAGPVHVEILQGFERGWERHDLAAAPGAVVSLDVDLGRGRWTVPDAGHWASADAHVHMNYGGVYRNTPEHLLLQAEAENLDLVNALIVNKEQRFPDLAYDGHHLDAASRPDALILHGQEFHTSYWGHLGLLDIDAVILPGYAGYPATAAASLVPTNADVADLAHARGAVVGYVHPFDEDPDPLRRPQQPLTNELPVDVALGKIDYMEIVGFSDHRATAAVWYRLLNLGFRLPAAAGTDAMANYASLRGPVGMNRVYARVPDGPLDPAQWLAALKAGRTFATNGPLLGLQIDGAHAGDELRYESPRQGVRFSARIESIVPVDHLDLVCNGRVVRSLARRRAPDHAQFDGTIPVAESGWCVLRASTDTARHPVLDNYVYATTSPVYLTVAGRAPRSAADARYFEAWIDRIGESVVDYPDWNSAAEKDGTLRLLARARAVYAGLEASATP